MQDANRSFDVEYYDPSSRDGTYDVTFRLTEDAEEALFTAMHREVEGNVRNGAFPEQKMHLLKRLADQHSEHPPWIETDGSRRVYDMVLTEYDYHLLTRMIGESLSNVLGPEGSPRYEELVDVWKDVTGQMMSQKITESGEDVIEQGAEIYDDNRSE